MRTRRRINQDAGVSSEPKMDLPEINDQGGHGHTEVPKSGYAIRETIDLTFTNRFVEGKGRRLSFADGDVRPGTTK
jgi:hypothetical protein